MARLAQLKEETRALEKELEAENTTTHNPIMQPSVTTPRAKTSRIPRTPDKLISRSMAASTNKTVLGLRDSVRASYNSVQLAFHRADRDRSKRVSKADFMQLLNRHSIPATKGVTDEIFNLLEQDHLGRIDYVDFMSMFTNPLPDNAKRAEWPEGKTVLPPALPTPPGLDQRPPTGMPNERPPTGFLDRPPTSRSMLMSRSGRPGTQAGPRKMPWQEGTVTLMSEVNDYVLYYRRKFDELFDTADIQGTGQVSKQQCQRIFQWVGLPMTSTQLDEILTSVGEKSDSKMVRYSQLLNKLSDLSLERPDMFDHIASVHFAPSHLLEVIRRRVRLKYKGCVWLLREEDSEGTGEISRAALLRIIKGVGLELSETQLEEVLTQMGLWPSTSQFGTVNAHRFLQQCVKEHVTPTKDEYLERSIASKIPKEIASAPKMNTHQLLQMLQDKMELSIKYPRDMFLKLDVDKDGFITKEELAMAFSYFNLYPTPKEVDELFRIVDEDRTGLISFQMFLKKLAPKKQYHFMEDTFTSCSQFNYLPTGTLSTIPRPKTSGGLQPNDLATIIRKQVRPNLRLVQVMLGKKDTANNGFISRYHLNQVLRKVDIYVSMPQMNQALENMGIPAAEDLNIEAFLSAVGPESGSVQKDDLRYGSSFQQYGNSLQGSPPRRLTAGIPTKTGENLNQGLGFGIEQRRGTGSMTARGRLETKTYAMEAQREKEQEEQERVERKLKAKWDAVQRAFAASEALVMDGKRESVTKVQGKTVTKEDFVMSLRKLDSSISPAQAMAIASVMDFSLGPSSVGLAQLAEILGIRHRAGLSFSPGFRPKTGGSAGGGPATQLSVDRLTLSRGSSRGGRLGTAGSGKGLKALLNGR